MDRVVELKLTRSVLRPLRPGDEDSLAAHANNRKVWRNLREPFPHPYTRAEAERWIRASVAEKPPTHLAIEVQGAVAGGIGLRFDPDRESRSAEFGFWIGEAHWNRGIMTEAVVAFTEYAFSTFSLRRLYARVFEWNPASMRVLEKAGYRREGWLKASVTKEEQTIDEALYGITRD